MIYLAAPYSTGIAGKSVQEVQADRSYFIDRATAMLRLLGHMVYSPITLGKPLEKFLSKEVVEDHDFWMQHCYHILARCDEVWVLMLEGWDKSKGVALEITYAHSHNMPVKYVDPETFQITQKEPQ